MSEEEMRQMMATLEYFRTQLESLAEQQQIVQLSREENIRARETLKEYGSSDDGSDILVPVGSNSFVYAKVASNKKVLVGLGRGITAEKSIDDALEIIEGRIGELTETIKKIAERRGVLEAENEKLSQKFQEAYQKLQQEPQR
jgi:prefoldin alpha subunit